MLNKLMFIFLSLGLFENGLAQASMQLDSCDFIISDTLDQGCGQYDHGMIWTYSSCDIHDFNLMVYDQYGVLIYQTDAIDAIYYQYEIEKMGYAGTQFFYWTVTGSIVVEEENKLVDWSGRMVYVW